jgi:hypothetical protein
MSGFTGGDSARTVLRKPADTEKEVREWVAGKVS